MSGQDPNISNFNFNPQNNQPANNGQSQGFGGTNFNQGQSQFGNNGNNQNGASAFDQGNQFQQQPTGNLNQGGQLPPLNQSNFNQGSQIPPQSNFGGGLPVSGNQGGGYNPTLQNQAINIARASDSEIDDSLRSLFVTLKGKVKDDTIAVSTLMALLINLNMDKEEPEFFSYVWKKCGSKTVV